METRYLLALHLSRCCPHVKQKLCFNDERLNSLYAKISKLCADIRNEYHQYFSDGVKCNDLRDLHIALEELFGDNEVNIGRISAAFVLASMYYEDCGSTYALYEINRLIERIFKKKGVDKWIAQEHKTDIGVRKYIEPVIAFFIGYFTNSLFRI